MIFVIFGKKTLRAQWELSSPVIIFFKSIFSDLRSDGHSWP